MQSLVSSFANDVLMIVGHMYLFRRHGVTVKDPDRAP